MNILRKKILVQVTAIIVFFSSIAMVTHFVAKTIIVRRRKTGKSFNSSTRTKRGFSPTDFIPSNVLPFSLDGENENYNPEQFISAKTLEVDELMSVELRVNRAIKRLEIALDELTTVSPESFPNPEISARILEGIFNFMRKKIRFSAWLEVLRVCQKPKALGTFYQEAFEYLTHTLPKEIDENLPIFDNFDLTERLLVFIKTIRSTPKFEDLSTNKVFQFLLVDFDMMTAPAHMLRRPISLKQLHQVIYYLSTLRSVCAFRAKGENHETYVMSSLEQETRRALALLRFDFDIWGRMTASRRALELSQRKDIDFSRFDLLPESSKASKLINSRHEL